MPKPEVCGKPSIQWGKDGNLCSLFWSNRGVSTLAVGHWAVLFRKETSKWKYLNLRIKSRIIDNR